MKIFFILNFLSSFLLLFFNKLICVKNQNFFHYFVYFYRKSESVVYSQMQEITVENLFEFVLSNVNVEIKLKMMIDECNRYRNIVSICQR